MHYVAKTTFFACERKVKKGAVVGHDDPVVKGREHLFTAVGEPEKKPEPEKVQRAPHHRPAQGKSKE